jgi:HEAT repeat protein
MPAHRIARYSPVLASLLTVALVAAQTPAPAPAPPARIPWEQDFDAAMQKAATEKKPIFVAFLMDNEPANDQTIKEHYTDPQIVALLDRFVCVVGCLGDHPAAEGGGCVKFHGLQCAHHNAMEKRARAKWLTDDLVCTPQHVFCDPKGAVLHRKIYLISKPTLAKVLVMTLEDCGIDVSGIKLDFGKDASGMPVDERERVTRWLADLASNNLEVRTAALSGLGAADDPRALPAVLAQCDAKVDDATRLVAIRALGRKGNHVAVARLSKMLGDGNALILSAVASALESIELETATPALVATMKKEKRDRVLGAVVRAAAKTQPANADVRDFCLKQVKTSSQQLQGHLLVALGGLAPHEKIVTTLKPLLASKNVNTRGLAVWALGNQGTPAALDALRDLEKNEKTPEIQKLLPQAIQRARGEVVEGYDSRYWSFFSSS